MASGPGRRTPLTAGSVGYGGSPHIAARCQTLPLAFPAMSAYQGPAIIVLDNGRELAVTANLRKDATNTWEGVLSVPDQSKPIELLNLPEGKLRIGEREGSFVRPDISDWMGSPAGLFQITIEGNGDAPF